jgi:hypothetical protein
MTSIRTLSAGRSVNGMALFLAIALCATGIAWGQQANPPHEDPTTESASQPGNATADAAPTGCNKNSELDCSANSQSTSDPAAQPGVEVGAVDGSGVVDIESRSPRKVSLQLSTIGGYDSALLSKSGLSTKFIGGQAVMGRLFSSSRSQLLLQDAVSGTRYSAGGGVFQKLNTVSIAFKHSINEKWNLQGMAMNTFGNDALRALAPIVQQPVGGTNGINPEATTYGLRTGNVLTTISALALNQKRTALNSWSFSVTNNDQRYFDYSLAENTLTGRADLLHAVNRSLSYGVYGIAIRQSGAMSCVNAGAGLSFSYRTSRILQFSGSGGPVSGTGVCGRAFEIVSNGSVSIQPTRNTAFFVTADRRPNTGLLDKAVWMTSLTGGVHHQLNSWMEASSSYAYTVGTSDMDKQSYQAHYFDASIRFLLKGGFSEDFSVRNYRTIGFELNPGQTIAVFTVWWSPRTLSQQSSRDRAGH